MHAESDISDQRGYTSYLEVHGVVRMPTIVLFRNGHPNQYPLDEPLSEESLTSWLESVTATPAPPRGFTGSHEEMVGEMLASEQAKRQQTPDMTPELLDKLQASARRKMEERAAGQQRQGEEEEEEEEGDDVGAAGKAGAAGGRCAELHGDAVSDASFEQTVMDKTLDVFVLFYKPTESFCTGNASVYGTFALELEGSGVATVAVHMDVKAYKSPFVFEDSELPVIMLFPAKDKRFAVALTEPEVPRSSLTAPESSLAWPECTHGIRCPHLADPSSLTPS